MSSGLRRLWPGLALTAALCGCGGKPTPAPMPPVTGATVPSTSISTTSASSTTSTTLPLIPSPPSTLPPATVTTTLPPPPPPPLVIPSPDRSTSTRSVSLSAVKAELDGQVGGSLVASDGNVYFAASTHSGSHGAAFFKYSPRSRELTCLTRDVTAVCGEDPAVAPQGAVSGPMVESEGWIYFATQFASEREGAAAEYPGSHVIGYQTSSGKFRDLGILEAGQTASGGVALDAQRRLLYVFTTPVTPEQAARGGRSLIHRINLATDRKEVATELRTGMAHTNAGLFVDGRGDAWFTLSGRPGTLYCVRAGPDRPVEQWPGVLPLRYSLRTEEVLPDTQQSDRCWTWVHATPNKDRCVFAAQEDGMLWEFDSVKAAQDVRTAFTPLRHIGPNGPGMCMAGDRVYYVQRAGRREGMRAPRWDANMHLMSVTTRPGDDCEITDHGLLTDQAGLRPWRIESMADDAAGRVFLCGSWHLRKGETAVRRYVWKGRDAWQPEPVGMFFSVIDLPARGKDK